ncbi:ER membrane protein complex subunit 10 [Patella vulgata]|uniref:ER membrane protein complex subunit 10 n=1 Tax=Patella vulgata TaxID=6465 RepID=UPI00217F8CC7|nr:ER membrane protein complex subunit 10 [Patella vulgata]
MAAPIKYTAVGLFLAIIADLSGLVHLDDEFEGSRTLTLEHSFTLDGNAVFSKRGTVVIRSLKGNKAHFTPASDFTREDINLLKKTSSQKGLYQLRVPVKEGSQQYVSTFIPACALYESSLNDQLTINFDQSGEVLGLSIVTTPGICVGLNVPVSNFSDWKTTVEVMQTVSGPVPDTQTYIDKMNRDKVEKEKGGQSDNRSFFGKYWMYIVPVVILMMIATSQDPNAGGGR